MKIYASLIASALFLTSCSISKDIADSDTLAIGLVLSEPGRSDKAFEVVEKRIGERLEFKDQREFLFPTSYTPANVESSTPPIPDEFASTKTGLKAEFTTRRQGAEIIIQGGVSLREFQGFSKMNRKWTQPIEDAEANQLLESRIEMPKFETYYTPIFLTLKTGESTKVEVAHPTKGTALTITLSE
ncbi:hypothetical protein [Roseibacillus ishigakijimensis]|uniref:Lipoprotein n=1 Tax=Roseibacillus ishigakijimensis TaxID=454146 RepID=A0A934VG46_9BACT|nr:hypothetical protein [Roseibacillus ishigakijimensis]MBK1832443.1 hypothetical protein [Roseibacillus ishigakijimensis]